MRKYSSPPFFFPVHCSMHGASASHQLCPGLVRYSWLQRDFDTREQHLNPTFLFFPFFFSKHFFLSFSFLARPSSFNITRHPTLRERARAHDIQHHLQLRRQAKHLPYTRVRRTGISQLFFFFNFDHKHYSPPSPSQCGVIFSFVTPAVCDIDKGGGDSGGGSSSSSSGIGPSNLSLGSVMLIVFFVVLFIYVAAGML